MVRAPFEHSGQPVRMRWLAARMRSRSMQRAADAAHAHVLKLRDDYGSPAHTEWGEQQSQTYETAWRAWRDLARDVQPRSPSTRRHRVRPDTTSKPR